MRQRFLTECFGVTASVSEGDKLGGLLFFAGGYTAFRTVPGKNSLHKN